MSVKARIIKDMTQGLPRIRCIKGRQNNIEKRAILRMSTFMNFPFTLLFAVYRLESKNKTKMIISIMISTEEKMEGTPPSVYLQVLI